MMIVKAFEHERWKELELKEFHQFSECIQYVNQDELVDCYQGEWFYCDDEKMIIYSGSFGNDNSPGASYYTCAELFDDETEYRTKKNEWESCPEFLGVSTDEN